MKILIVGSGPLPSENRGIANAGGLRTEQFFTSTKQDKAVSLFVFENKSYKGIKRIKRHDEVCHVAVSKQDPQIKKLLKQFISEINPDAVVGVNSWPSFVVSQVIDNKIPFWADLNGWMLAELQVQSFAMDDDSLLMHGIKLEQATVRRADKISVVSTAQKFAVIGELGMLGRLGKDNFRHSFVEVIENSCRPIQANEKRRKNNIFRGKLFPQDAAVLLWVGGFNAWSDELTLFKALKIVMEDNKDIHFVCSGEILKGIDESTLPRFRKRIEATNFSERCHFLGWVPAEQMPQLYHECDIGLNVDLPCIETATGARNRLNEMLRFGLPVVTTEGAEITTILKRHDAAVVCASENANEIAAGVQLILRDKGTKERLQRNAEILKNNQFSVKIAQRPFLTWLKSPETAYSSKKNIITTSLGHFKTATRVLRQRGLRAFLKKCRQYVSLKIG